MDIDNFDRELEAENSERDIEHEKDDCSMDIAVVNENDDHNEIGGEISRVEREEDIERILTEPIEVLISKESELPNWVKNSHSFKTKKAMQIFIY